MADILVSENVVGPAMEQLEREFDVAFDPDLWRDAAQLQERLRGARALIVRNQTQVTAELIDAAEQLQVIGRAGAGLDNVETRAASETGVVVTYAPRENSVSVAELTVALLLSLARKIPAADRDTRSGGWDRRRFTGIELSEKVLGIVGLGRIGVLTAERAKAFGMQVIAHDDYLDPASPPVRQLDAKLTGLDQLLAESDFVSCHVPLTAETEGMFDYDGFCRMKPTAMFVNASRGEIVDEQGLVRALDEQRLAGAALDVRSAEPPAASPLCEMDNVILTPHIGAFTREAQARVVAAVCQDVAAVLRGEAARNAFNFAKPRGGRAG